MKPFVLFSILCCILGSCSKTDEATKANHYADVIYRINAADSALFVQFRRAVYNENQKGNLRIDTNFPAPGVYTIPATVLREEITLYGESYRSGNFCLEILSADSSVLVKTDSLPLDPANALHPDRWLTTIKVKF